MRLYQPLLILLFAAFSVAGPSAASAQDDSNGGMAIGVVPPPPVDEYNNIPPGILMSGETPIADTTLAAPAEEEVMTMEDLTSAYNKGQYDLVAKHLLPIADSSYPQAEELLGIMYHSGQGVAKDPKAAVDWLTKAAEAGRPLAQHHLAIMSFAGDGMPQDSVKALMWLYIACVHYPEGEQKQRAIADRDNILGQMGRRDRERAFLLAHDWLEKRDEAPLLEHE